MNLRSEIRFQREWADENNKSVGIYKNLLFYCLNFSQKILMVISGVILKSILT